MNLEQEARAFKKDVEKRLKAMEDELRSLNRSSSPASVRNVLLSMNQGILALQRQIDEGVVNEIALLASLKELVPGFWSKFELLRNAEKKVVQDQDAADVAAIQAEIEKLDP